MTEPSHTRRPHVVVLGLMGVGKSTTAQALARAQRVAHHDSDNDLETTFGATGNSLAGQLGVAELHRLESAMLLGRLAAATPAVISAAASVVEDERCHEALRRRAFVTVLHAPVELIAQRAASADHRREIDSTELAALAAHRAPLFDAISDLDLDATMATNDLVSRITAALTT